jgi:hypothetical protein
MKYVAVDLVAYPFALYNRMLPGSYCIVKRGKKIDSKEATDYLIRGEIGVYYDPRYSEWFSEYQTTVKKILTKALEELGIKKIISKSESNVFQPGDLLLVIEVRDLFGVKQFTLSEEELNRLRFSFSLYTFLQY